MVDEFDAGTLESMVGGVCRLQELATPKFRAITESEQ
jgi:hypothetical protein